MLIVIVISLIIIVDQISKYLVRLNFQQGETLPVISDVLHLTYIRNRGAAFSMFENLKVMTIIFPALILTASVIILILFNKRITKLARIAISLIIGGGLGNLIDRIIYGYVTDMIDLRVFPVFNIADISVCVGSGLLILAAFLPGGITGVMRRDDLLENGDDER